MTCLRPEGGRSAVTRSLPCGPLVTVGGGGAGSSSERRSRPSSATDAPVRVRVDEELTVEVRAVEPAAAPKRSAADAFRELGRWEGETGADFDALFADVRQRSNRQVPDLQ